MSRHDLDRHPLAFWYGLTAATIPALLIWAVIIWLILR